MGTIHWIDKAKEKLREAMDHINIAQRASVGREEEKTSQRTFFS